MGSSNEMDFGGLTLVVDGLKVGATSAGQAGTSLTGTEITLIDGLTAGTVTASKAVVVDANKDIATFRHVTLSGNLVTGSTTLSEAELGVLDSAAAANSGTTKAMITGTSGALTVAGALTAQSTVAATGAITPTGGVAASGGYSVSPRNMNTGGNPPSVSTDFSDYTVVTTETIRSEIFVPSNTSSTGVAILNGSAAAGNLQAYLIDSTGAQIAGVLTASTAQSGTDAYQRIPWAGGPYTIKGPATYWVAVQGNNTGGKINTHTIGNFGADKQTGTTYGTLTVAAAPTTFTTALGPVASLY